MRYPTLAASPHPPFDVSSFAPLGVSIVNNMMMARFHRGPSALTYSWFYQQVRRHGPWDYKQRGKGFESFGNFHYGAVGHAAGISDEILLRGQDGRKVKQERAIQLLVIGMAQRLMAMTLTTSIG